jgi:hypothetical protein
MLREQGITYDFGNTREFRSLSRIPKICSKYGNTNTRRPVELVQCPLLRVLISAPRPDVESRILLGARSAAVTATQVDEIFSG